MSRWRLFLMLALAFGATASAEASPWSDVTTPTPGPASSIGKPAAGCLAGAVTLPFDGQGFQVIRVSRVRYFGHPQTVAFVEELGQKAAAASILPFYVGDMSLPRGGPMPNGHDSHQTGLDVDIWFNLDPKSALAPAAREDVSLPSMLLPNGRAIDPRRFGAPQVTLLRLATTFPVVDRIFVNPAIKRALCNGLAISVTGDRSWLHKIRPWFGHDEHFHVRTICPAGSAGCVHQAAVPAGDGCDASLDWWFRPHPPNPKAGAPVLPAACSNLIAR